MASKCRMRIQTSNFNHSETSAIMRILKTEHRFNLQNFIQMKRKLLLLALACTGLVQAQTPDGQWTFDDPSALTKATFGSNLELVGTTESIDGPTAADKAVRIGPGSHFKMVHGTPANGGGEYVNEYTLSFDVRFSESQWISLFQTSTSNSNDGEIFIAPENTLGVADIGYTNCTLKPNEWYRVTFTCDWYDAPKPWTSEFVEIPGMRIYVDGVLALDGYPMFRNIGKDARFALDEFVLLFGDENGDDNLVDCANVSYWGRALSHAEVAGLAQVPGTEKHDILPVWIENEPYLQTPTSTSVYVSWRNEAKGASIVEYGTTESLGSTLNASSRCVQEWDAYVPVFWHEAALTELTPDTEYFYRVKTGDSVSKLFKFKTQPEAASTKKIRFLMIGDTQQNPEINEHILSKAKQKIEQTYGTELQNALNFVWHTGDLVQEGHSNLQYHSLFFAPFRHFSSAVPVMVTTGNHEHESGMFYDYMKYDNISAFQGPLFEKAWSMQLQNTLFVTLNSANDEDLQGDQKNLFTEQTKWLDAKLAEAQANPAIDFVFVAVHKTPISEMWIQGEMPYVKNEVLPVLQKYSKVQQLTYGHTHSYERGIWPSKANGATDITLACVGGGGGNRDVPGGADLEQKDYPEINISLGDNFFVLAEIDPDTKSYEFKTYSFGNSDRPLDCELVDSWKGKKEGTAPAQPTAFATQRKEDNLLFEGSGYKGSEPMFSAQIQVALESGDFSTPVFDQVKDVRNIYGRDENYLPTDLNAGLDIRKFEIPTTRLDGSQNYKWRLRYRDITRRWSAWSEGNPTALNSLDAGKVAIYQTGSEVIATVDNTSGSAARLEVFNLTGNLLKSEVKNQTGQISFQMSTDSFDAGIYIWKITLNGGSFVQKVIIP